MEKIFVFKAAIKDNALQLCVSIKGMSAMGRSYRVINVNHPGLDKFDKSGKFIGGGNLCAVANNAIKEAIDRANLIVASRNPSTIKEFLQFYDNDSAKKTNTLGEFLEMIMEEQRRPTDGRAVSLGWRHTKTIIRKMDQLGYINYPLSHIGNAFYIQFCNDIKSGNAPDAMHGDSHDQGCHGYRGSVSTFKTLLNKAYRKGLISEEITYDWSKEMPLRPDNVDMARMNVPTEEEWEKFLKLDLRHYTYANRDIHRLEMMRAVVIVLVETLSRPVDVIRMKKSDIKNMAWSYIPEKFKNRPDAEKKRYKKPIGLTNMAYKAILRCSAKSDCDYVFPFSCNTNPKEDADKLLIQVSNVGTKINAWLKMFSYTVFQKQVSLYSFRHFAITRAINKGLNVAEVASLAKTSIQQINDTYYDKDGISSMNKLESLLNA